MIQIALIIGQAVSSEDQQTPLEQRTDQLFTEGR
jgi:hypothetical protein